MFDAVCLKKAPRSYRRMKWGTVIINLQLLREIRNGKACYSAFESVNCVWLSQRRKNGHG